MWLLKKYDFRLSKILYLYLNLSKGVIILKVNDLKKIKNT